MAETKASLANRNRNENRNEANAESSGAASQRPKIKIRIREVVHNNAKDINCAKIFGMNIITGSHDKTAKVTCLWSGDTIATVSHDESVFAVAISHDGSLIATGSGD